MKINEISFLRENYIAFTFDDATRQRLRERFPPKYPEFIAHHITYHFGVPENHPLPNVPDSVKIVGHADNGTGLEALVVEVDGEIHRKDGSLYHITWSLDRSKGFKPKDSNALVKEGFEPIDPIEIAVLPRMLK